jgi:hypothetical protein
MAAAHFAPWLVGAEEEHALEGFELRVGRSLLHCSKMCDTVPTDKKIKRFAKDFARRPLDERLGGLVYMATSWPRFLLKLREYQQAAYKATLRRMHTVLHAAQCRARRSGETVERKAFRRLRRRLMDRLNRERAHVNINI